jgi:L-iditol 2-dehydrogenase
MVFMGDCKVDLREFDDPSPGPGEVIVEMKASGMCGTDLHYYRHGMASSLEMLGMRDRMESDLIIGGHEPCGVVAAVGPGVDPKSFRVGDRVIVFHYDGCLACQQCRSGWTQLCGKGARIFGVLSHGGHAEYMKVPAASLVHLPDALSFVAGAAIACGTGTAYGALLRLGITARDTLAVFGLGPVGLSVAQLAAAMGVEVFGIDVNADRVERAKAFGVAHAIDGSKLDPVDEIHRLTGGHGATCAIDCAGVEISRRQAVQSTGLWGRVAMVAVGGGFSVDVMKDLVGKQRTLMGSFTLSEGAMQDCAEFIAKHELGIDALFTSRWRLEDAADAYEDFNKQSSGKGVFVF